MPIEEAVVGSLDVNGGIQVDQSGDSERPSVKASTFCAMCPDEPLEAEFSCVTCSALPLCLSCKNKHMTRMKGHETVPYGESSEVMCVVHPDKKLEICCVDPCNKTICSICVMDHAGHKFTSLSAAAERARAELEQASAESTEGADAFLADSSLQLNKHEAAVKSALDKVDAEKTKLIRQIEQRAADAKAAIVTKMAPELLRLRENKKVAGDVVGRVRSNVAVSRRLGDPDKCSHIEVFRLTPVS
jgi:ribulose 1,5-bisphosphate synthetase/thiazole synthase